MMLFHLIREKIALIYPFFRSTIFSYLKSLTKTTGKYYQNNNFSLSSIYQTGQEIYTIANDFFPASEYASWNTNCKTVQRRSRLLSQLLLNWKTNWVFEHNRLILLMWVQKFILTMVLFFVFALLYYETWMVQYRVVLGVMHIYIYTM